MCRAAIRAKDLSGAWWNSGGRPALSNVFAISSISATNRQALGADRAISRSSSGREGPLLAHCRLRSSRTSRFSAAPAPRLPARWSPWNRPQNTSSTRMPVRSGLPKPCVSIGPAEKHGAISGGVYRPRDTTTCDCATVVGGPMMPPSTNRAPCSVNLCAMRRVRSGEMAFASTYVP